MLYNSIIFFTISEKIILLFFYKIERSWVSMVITSIERQKKNTHRKSVYIDKKYAFGLDDEDLFRLNLFIGKEITKDEIDKINQTCNFSKAKNIALKYIMYMRRTEYELNTKLNQAGFDEVIIKQVIHKLKELNYINDVDYIERYIKDAINLKKFGEKRIRLELMKKGIGKALINEKINNITIDELKVLKPLIEKRISHFIKDSKILDYKSLNKIRNYFLRRGYSLYNINKIINEVSFQEDIIKQSEKRDEFEL